jgi:hypothetical protein
MVNPSRPTRSAGAVPKHPAAAAVQNDPRHSKGNIGNDREAIPRRLLEEGEPT